MWFVALVTVEVALELPFCAVAVYAYARRRWGTPAPCFFPGTRAPLLGPVCHLRLTRFFLPPWRASCDYQQLDPVARHCVRLACGHQHGGHPG